MRRSFAAVISIILFTTALSGETIPSADLLLQRGKDHFRSGHYQDAVSDLEAASAGFLTPAQKQAYIASGHLATLPKFEESLVYLALAQSHLGHDAEAMTAITRLLNAERIEPVYAGLKLDPDAGELETIVVALMPAVPLPPNAQLAAGASAVPAQSTTTSATKGVPPPPSAAPPEQTAMSTPAPATTPAPIFVPTGTTSEPTLVATHPPAPVQTASVPPPPPAAAPAPVATQPATIQNAGEPSKLAVQPTLAAERAEMLKAVDEQVARQVAEKVALARAEIERDAQQRIAAEKEAAQRAADARIVEARQAADQRVAEERAAAEKASAARIAEEREAAQRAADQKVAAERAAAERAARARLAEAEAQARRGLLASLRQADSAAANGQVADASRMYAQLASTPDVSREAVAAAAAGLYRVGDFAAAVKAFQRLGTFTRGEEDLRYYNAVALFETGHYEQAKKELACALPFIQINDDVARYRVKIEQMAAQQAMR